MTVGHHAQRRRGLRRRATAFGVGVALMLVGYTAAQVDVLSRVPWAGTPDRTVDTGCPDTETLHLTVAPRIEPAVSRALDELDEPCLVFEMTTRPERAAVDAVFVGGAVPDIWIPDGTWGLPKMPVDVVAAGLASTPVLLVGGPAARPVSSWADAFTSGSVALPDPLDDSVGTLAVMAPRQEAEATGRDVQAARGFLVPTAQAYGEVAAQGRRQPGLELISQSPTSARLVATTEADYLDALGDRSTVRPLVPRSGVPLMRFPLAVREDASAPTRRVARALVAWFRSDRGDAALRDVGLRHGDGARVARGVGVGRVRFLPPPDAADVDDYRFTWRVMSVPSSVLAVFDVSGSMAFATTGGGTRMDVAAGAAEVSLDLFPDHARVGVWVFSTRRGGPSQDWRMLEPLRRLDTEVAGVSQRDRLRARVAALRTLANGGTGLYDTTLAAYRQALRRYDPDYANSVILITDGANDDERSISRAALLRRLRALADPDRPVRIIAIGISADADLAALRRIAESTGGRAHRADSPEDILQVFAQEIANR